MNKFIFSIFILLLSHSVFAKSESDWTLIKKVTVKANQPLAYSISGNVADMDIEVRLNDKIISTQNGPEGRDASEFIVLESHDNTVIYDIWARATYKIPFSINTGIEFKQVNANLSVVQDLYKASQLWFKRTDEKRKNALLLLKNSTQRNRQKSELNQTLIIIYAWMLEKSEDYQGAYQVSSEILKSKALINEQLMIKALWVQAVSMYWLQDYIQANQLFTKLDAMLNQNLRNDFAWLLNREKIRGRLGLSRTESGRLKANAVLIEEGKNLLETAISNADQLGDKKLIAELLNELATYYRFVNDFTQCEKFLRLSVTAYEESESNDGLPDTLSNLALLLLWTGRIAESQQMLRQALAIVNSRQASETIAYLNKDLGMTYETVGDYAAAKRYYKRALLTHQAMNSDYGAAVLQNGLGRLARMQGDFEEAIDYHKKSLQYFSNELPEHAASLMVELSKDYFVNGYYKTAKQYADMALHTSESTFRVAENIESLLLLSRIARKENKFQRFHSLLKQAESLFKGEKFLPVQQLALYQLWIEHYLTLNKIDSVDFYASKALTLIHKIRRQLDSARLGPSWINKTHSIINLYIYALINISNEELNRKQYAQVFRILEENHALNLRERRLRFASHDEKSGKAQNKKLKALWENYLSIERQVAYASGPVEKQNALIKADEAREAFLSFSPLPGNIKDPSLLRNLSIEEVQQYLKPDEMFLRYYVQDKLNFAFVVTSESWEVLELPSQSELLKLNTALNSDISKRQLSSGEALKSFASILPIDQLKKNDYRKLIFVTDGILHSIPFSAINIASDDSRYLPLASQYEIVRTHSASGYFSATAEKRTTHLYDIAIFADPVFNKELFLSGAYEKSIPDRFRAWNKSLSRLPWTAQEALSISKIFSQSRIKTAIGTEATNQVLMSSEMRNAKILHIASHGFFSSDTPDIVGIATSVIDSKSVDSPGFLTLTELLSKPFTSDLIVISGCETALGKQLNGEGLNGLSRGLLSQGAGSVIGTLWSIPDRPTAAFMKAFYIALKKTDGNTSLALKITKAQFARSGRYRDPLYWAGFVLLSANSSFESKILF